MRNDQAQSIATPQLPGESTDAAPNLRSPLRLRDNLAEWGRLICQLGRKMLPSRHLVFIATARLSIGMAAINLSPLLPWESARGWVEFGGRIFIVLAIMNLLAYPEGIFMDALSRNFERLTGIKIRG